MKPALELIAIAAIIACACLMLADLVRAHPSALAVTWAGCVVGWAIRERSRKI